MVVQNWIEIIQTATLSRDKEMDLVSRWLISKAGLRNAILLVNAIDAAIAVYLVAVRGWPVLLFAGLGFFISVFYVAPPVRLKHIGLGELGVFIVWGPLMIGGSYYCAAG